MQKITSHLWFDKEAREAGDFYTSIFPDSKAKNITVLHNTSSGDVDIVTVDLAGQEFTLLSAGPLFKFNPSVSYLIACQTKEEVDELWTKLSEGGKPLMELGSYPFSERYGWTEDKYGLSWQIMYAGGNEIKQKITPVLMFVGDVYGKAEEAINFYASVFRNAKVGDIARYPTGLEPDKEGTVMYSSFTLEGQEFGAMDSARMHDFKFNEAISFIIHCENQEEIDYYWEKLSAVPEAEQCGWLKDKYGLSWQVVPNAMDKLMESTDQEKINRVTKAFLKMKKFDIAELEKAAAGNTNNEV
jgi:predicted 3-demethylubiquinone-9 3-methyltransferase (glyoxalase superfamily)